MDKIMNKEWRMTVSDEYKTPEGELKTFKIDYFFNSKEECINKIENVMNSYNYIKEEDLDYPYSEVSLYVTLRRESGLRTFFTCNESKNNWLD